MVDVDTEVDLDTWVSFLWENECNSGGSLLSQEKLIGEVGESILSRENGMNKGIRKKVPGMLEE